MYILPNMYEETYTEDMIDKWLGITKEEFEKINSLHLQTKNEDVQNGKKKAAEE